MTDAATAEPHSAGLVERDAELQALRRSVDRVLDGDGGVVVVQGPPGIGVSALLRAAERLADDRGLAVRRSREPPVGLEDALPACLQGAVATNWVAPVGRSAADGTPGPLLLPVDDVDADDPALRRLARLRSAARSAGVLVVIGLRGVAGDVLGASESRGGPAVLAPVALTADGVGTLLLRATGEPPDQRVAAAVREVLGGRPGRVRTLADELRRRAVGTSADDLPAVSALADAVLVSDLMGRVSGPSTREVAEAVALLGGATTPGRLARIVDLPVAAVHEALDELVAGGILVPGPAASFLRGAERDALARTATQVRRHRVQTVGVAVLAADGEVRAAGELLLAVPPAGDPTAVEVLRSAADLAMAEDRGGDAILLYERLLAEPLDHRRRSAALVALGIAQVENGRPDGGDTLEAALGEARDPADVGTAAAALGWALAGSLDGEAAARTLQAARDRVRAAGQGLDIALDVQIADMAAWNAELGPARADAVDRLRDRSGSALARAAATAAEAVDLAATGGPAPELVDRCQRALGGGELAADPHGVPTALALSLFLGYGGQARLGVDHVDHVLSRLRVEGSPTLVRTATAFRGALRLMLGELEPAERDLRAVVDAPWVVRSTPLLMSFLLLCLLERGDGDGAARVIARVELAGGAPRPSLPDAPFLFARGAFRAQRGDPYAALQDHQECGRRLVASGWTTPAAGWRGAAARSLVALGRTEEGRVLADEEVRRAEHLATPSVLGRALRAQAATLGGDEARRLLDRAATITQDGAAPLEHVAALLDLAAAEIDDGDATAARARLHGAVPLAHALGAVAQAGCAAELLIAAGGRVRRARATAAGGLTPSEHRVATLAARGLTNAEICAELVVTRKTVESHLGAAFRKLGIGSRAQLPEALGNDRPDAP